jgi:hypothetical protein
MPFKCFWEEVRENIPGGIKRKALRLKRYINGCADGLLHGATQTWSYREIRNNDLYEECARDIYRSPLGFWVSTIGIPLVALFAVRWLIFLVTMIK